MNRSIALLLAKTLPVLLIISSGLSVRTQQPQTPPDMQIDAATKTAVIDNLIKELNDGYVFPEVAKKLEADLRGRQSAKEYESMASAQSLAKKLTKYL